MNITIADAWDIKQQTKTKNKIYSAVPLKIYNAIFGVLRNRSSYMRIILFYKGVTGNFPRI